MIARRNRITGRPRGVRAMAGLTGGGVALACLLGLAACGGGGGGGTAGGGGNGGGNGDPMPMPFEPTFLEEDAAAVVTMNTAIDARTLRPLNSSITLDRIAELVNFRVTTEGDDAPGITAFNFSTSADLRDLKMERLGDSAWLFTDTYTVGSTNFRDIIVMSYDATVIDDPVDAGNDQHFWGVWMRQNTDTGDWNSVDLFNWRSVASEPELSLPVQNALEGSATFTGGALGVYTRDASSAGWFSADAELTVNFGGSGIDAADQFTMTGTIGNFALSGHENNDWSVTLSGGPPKPTGGGLPTDNVWTGTAAGGSATDNGAFTAVFTRASAATPVVLSVMRGTFKAAFTDGKAVGAFNVTPAQ